MTDRGNHLATSVVVLGVDEVETYSGNPRRGDVDAIAASLARLRQYRPIVVRRSTMEVLCGNHTLRAARHLGWPTIAATMVDVTDVEAAAIVAADNRLADLGGYDDQARVDLLTPMREEAPDLFGITGYVSKDLDDLLAAVSPTEIASATAARTEPTQRGVDVEVHLMATIAERLERFGPNDRGLVPGLLHAVLWAAQGIEPGALDRVLVWLDLRVWGAPDASETAALPAGQEGTPAL